MLITSFVSRVAMLLSLAITVIVSVPVASRAEGAATFSSAEEAVTALANAARGENSAQTIVSILGPEGEQIVKSGDDIADETRRANFLAAFDESHQLQKEETRTVLVIGKDEFPFPVPLVEKDGKWVWDTAAGLDEILTRRIGENELSAIEVMRTYVAAQAVYAEKERDGRGIQYARRLMSQEGRQDGLYWPAAEGEEPSPIGPLMAEAQRQGYRKGAPSYHGYVYRMLYGQGRHAPGGTRDFIVNDRMIGGFGLIATPAQYGNSGVMTFIVNQDGVVYEKDLGPDTVNDAASIKLFDPDETWKKVSEE